MKIRMLILLCFIAVAAACNKVEEQVVSALFRNYVSAQAALAQDDYTGAQQALLSLSEESNQQIQTLAKEVAECEDIKSVREKFKELSEVVTQLPLPKGYVVAFCPMADDGKGASWVQPKGEIQNPYFGAKMLTCGEVTQTQ